jgi:hypothetical protein
MSNMKPNPYRHPPLTEEQKIIARAELARRAERERQAQEFDELVKRGLASYDYDENFEREPEPDIPEMTEEEEKAMREENRRISAAQAAEVAARPDPTPEEIAAWVARIDIRHLPDLESYLED